MKIVGGVNQVTDDVYYIAHPLGRVYTGITLLVGDRLALVDSALPPAADEYVFPLVRRLGLTEKDIDIVVNTHWHGDHIGCNKQIKIASGATIAIHVKDKPLMESLDAQRVEFYDRFPHHFPPPALDERNTCRADLVLREADRLKLGRRQFEVIGLPGHTPGSIGLHDRAGRMLLTGDSVQGRGIEGHLAMVMEVEPYLAALRKAQELPVERIIMNHAYSPFDSAVLEGQDAAQLLRESIATVEEYVSALQAYVGERRRMSLVEATDFLCARYGTRPRSLMAMCTTDSILRKLGVERE